MNEIKCPKCGTTFTIDEDDYASIVKQIRDSEFQKALEAAEASKKSEIKLAVNEVESKLNEEIIRLKAQIAADENSKKLAISEAIDAKNQELADQKQLNMELSNKLQSSVLEKELAEKSIKETYEARLKMKEDEVAYYKDLKSRLNNKMLGETLEQHCEIEFNKLRATAFRLAQFGKDNTVSKESGSKGDYIFRDYTDDGLEYISIMFEMKNEADETKTKHKNEDFFKELDKDRKEKNCEYAVLVSMLEPENELYNEGIVDVSYQYDKMYVIRPQFFIPLITILRNAAQHSIEFQKELAVVKAQNIDVSNFESELNDFKDKIRYNYEHASTNFGNAIKEIDKSIAELEKVKKSLETAVKHLGSANNKAEELTVKKLTKGNPTMIEMFAAAKDAEMVEVVE